MDLRQILALTYALKYGQSLTKAETWKKVQIVTPYLAALLGAIVSATCGDCISLSDQNLIVQGLGALGVSIFNHYLTVATTNKLGV